MTAAVDFRFPVEVKEVIGGSNQIEDSSNGKA